MSENLKVNSKTDILEFKRKHNKLVENITTEENGDVTIGGTTSVENLYIQGEIVDEENNSAVDIGTSDISVSKKVNIGDFETPKNLYVSGDLSVTGDATAKTFEQENANWKGDNIIFNAPTGLTITNTYNRLEVINGILFCVVNFKLENNSGESQVFNGVDLQTGISVSKYAEQIIDVNGNSVNESDLPTDYAFITGEPAMILKNSTTYNGTYLKGMVMLCNRQNVNYLSVFAYPDTTITLLDGEYIFFTGRIALTLI